MSRTDHGCRERGEAVVLPPGGTHHGRCGAKPDGGAAAGGRRGCRGTARRAKIGLRAAPGALRRGWHAAWAAQSVPETPPAAMRPASMPATPMKADHGRQPRPPSPPPRSGQTQPRGGAAVRNLRARRARRRLPCPVTTRQASAGEGGCQAALAHPERKGAGRAAETPAKKVARARLTTLERSFIIDTTIVIVSTRSGPGRRLRNE